MTKTELIAALANYPDDAVIHVRDRWVCDASYVDAVELRSEVRKDWNNWKGDGEVPTITVIEIDT